MANPGQFIVAQLLSLFALGVLALAIYLLYAGTRRRTVAVFAPRGEPPSNGSVAGSATASRAADPGARSRTVFVEDKRWNARRRWLSYLALTLVLLLFAGKFLGGLFFKGGTGNVIVLPPATQTTVRGSSGAELAVTEYGPKDGPTLLFTHGWGNDHRQWAYIQSALPPKYHVVVWDLPGLGSSTVARDYSMQTLAGDLNSVVLHFPGQPIVLVGHSIGGMLNLEFARRYPDQMRQQVRGLVELDTSYTNPVRTKKNAERSTGLQKPVFEPLLHVIEWISHLTRIGGWFAYQSGLAHLQLAMDSFTGTESWAQLDEMARYAYRSSPSVIALGTLGMLHWDASDALKMIGSPTLVIVGNQDTTTLPSASEHIAHEIRASTLIAVDHAAHLGPVEQYVRYAKEIDAFATQVFGSGAVRNVVMTSSTAKRAPARVAS